MKVVRGFEWKGLKSIYRDNSCGDNDSICRLDRNCFKDGKSRHIKRPEQGILLLSKQEEAAGDPLPAQGEMLPSSEEADQEESEVQEVAHANEGSESFRN